ncbi:hypothetical protein MBLNU457_6472t1 [Dothideomycetes sp. NU457]
MTATQQVFDSPELMDLIAAGLPTKDICHLRAVNRAAERNTWHLFKTAFREKWFEFTKPGLKRLWDISKHERLASELTGIKFLHQDFNFDDRGKLVVPTEFRNVDDELWQMYTTFLEQQKAFFDSGMASHLLQDAFANLAKLGTILAVWISPEDYFEQLDSEPSLTGNGLEQLKAMSQTFCGHERSIGQRYDFVQNDALIHVLQAILTSNLHVEKLEAPDCSLTKRVWHGVRQAASGNTTFLEHLRVLQIANAWPSMPRADMLEFQAFWGKNRVRHLSLTEPYYAQRDSESETLIGNLFCPELTQFALESLYWKDIGYEDHSSPKRTLADFVLRHRKSLEKLDLSQAGQVAMEWEEIPRVQRLDIFRALSQIERLSSFKFRFFIDTDRERAGLYPQFVGKELRYLFDDDDTTETRIKVGPHLFAGPCSDEIEQPALDRVIRERLANFGR